MWNETSLPVRAGVLHFIEINVTVESTFWPINGLLIHRLHLLVVVTSPTATANRSPPKFYASFKKKVIDFPAKYLLELSQESLSIECEV